MEITRLTSAQEVKGDAAVIATYFSDEGIETAAGEQLGELVVEGLAEATRRGETRGELFSRSLFRGAPDVLFIGLGKRRDLSGVRWKRVIESATRFLTRRGVESIAAVLPTFLSPDVAARAAVSGAIAGIYDESFLQTEDVHTYELNQLAIVSPAAPDIAQLERFQVTAESANVARDLVNLPPNDLTPSMLADRAMSVGTEAGLQVQVLDEAAMAELGMAAILGVGRGSSEPPRVIDMTYGSREAPVKLTFVGKGLTFDSGGLSLKPADAMEWMKADMGGAAAVIGAMRAVGLLKPNGVFVRGLIGATENMPGPGALKPGDVLRTMNGKTIEVLNTDAEGRLVLSDMLEYAVRLGATHIVDLATLTGSAVIALGHEASPLIGRPQEWVDTIRTAADTAVERMWQLPLFPEYRRQIISDIADMKNIGGRAAGALTAAALLAEFVDGIPWAHLDIAGTAWMEDRSPQRATGGTGYGVSTLVQLAFDLGGETS